MRTFVLALALAAAPAVRASVAIPERATAMVRRLRDSEGRAATAWPGFSILSRPVAAHFPGIGTLFIGHPKPPSGSTLMDSGTPMTAYFSPDFELALAVRFDPHRPVNGHETFALLCRPEDPFKECAETLVHETFHLHQSARGWRDRFPAAPESPPSTDGRMRALRGLEGMLLAEALLGGEEWRQRARAFTALRERRRSGTPSGLRLWEEREETLEGLADYVALRASMPDRPDAAEAPILSDRIGRILFDPIQGDASKSPWFYASGAAQAFLLERADPEWRRKFSEGRSLWELMLAAFPPDYGEASAARWRLGLDELFRLELAEDRPEEVPGHAQRESARLEFESSPGVRLRLSGIELSSFSYGATAVHRLGEAGTLYFGVSAAEGRSPGARIVFRDTSLLKRPGEIRSLLGPDPKLSIMVDGRPSSLGPTSRTFRTLRLETDRASLETDRPGRIQASGDVVDVAWP